MMKIKIEKNMIKKKKKVKYLKKIISKIKIDHVNKNNKFFKIINAVTVLKIKVISCKVVNVFSVENVDQNIIKIKYLLNWNVKFAIRI